MFKLFESLFPSKPLTELPSNVIPSNYEQVIKKLGDRHPSNCWGTTLFLLGQSNGLEFCSGDKMNGFLNEFTTEVVEPKPGDIAVYRIAPNVDHFCDEYCQRSEHLQHTALCMGNDRYIHQQGFNGPFKDEKLSNVSSVYGGNKIRVTHVRFVKDEKRAA